MRIIYKCLTAVLVAIVTSFSASAFTLDIDHPEGVVVALLDGDQNTVVANYTGLVSGENSISVDYAGYVVVKPNSPWVFDSATSSSGSFMPLYAGDFRGGKFAAFSANGSEVFTVRVSNPEAPVVPDPTFITLNVDNPEGLNVQLSRNEVSETLTLVAGNNEISSTEGGTLTISANESWQIESVTGEGDVQNNGGEYVINFNAGDEYHYVVVTKQITAEPKLIITVDHPEALEVQFSSDWGSNFGEVITLTETVTEIGISGYQKVRFKAVSPWVVDTFSEDVLVKDEDYYTAWLFSSEDVKVNFTTSKPSFITLNVDNPEALNVQVMYADPDETFITPTLVQGENKISSKYPGTLIVGANDSWTIVSAEGLMEGEDPMTGKKNYGTNFEAGSTNVYTITTEKEEAQSSYITLTVDYPERVKVEVMDISISPVEPVDGVYKINTTNQGTIYVTPVSSNYGLSVPEGWKSNSGNGGYYFDFAAGATDTYGIYTYEQHYCTLNIDHPEAVKAEVSYDGGTNFEAITLTGTETKYAITGWGSIRITPVSPWNIDSCVGDPTEATKDEAAGTYSIFIGTNQDQTITVTTSKPESTYITLTVDNPEALNVQLSRNQESETLTLVAGANQIDSSEDGTIVITANESYQIESTEGEIYNYGGSEYFINFYAGDTGTYSITTKQVASDPTFITLNVNDPAALDVYLEYEDGTADITLQAGDNIIYTEQSGLLQLLAKDTYVIVSAEGFQNMEGNYYLPFEAGATGTYYVTTAKDAQTSYITLTVDNPERVKVEVMDITISPVEPVDGEFKINTTNGGTIYVTPVSSDYGITAPEGWTSNGDNGGYYIDFTAGATDTYAITTFEQSLFTVNIDHPEAFRMVADDYGNMYTVVAGDNKFNAKNGANNLCFYVKDTWEVVSFTDPNGGEITKNPYTGAYIIAYNSTTTGTYTVVTREAEVAFEGITINVDNLEAVTVSVEYYGEEIQTVEPEDGVYKIDTTVGGYGGTIYLDRVYPWDIVSAGSFTAHWKIAGRYYFDFAAGETGNYNVITKNTLEGATSITLNVDNPQALNVKVTYYSGVEKTIELQAGANKIPTADGGTLEVSAIEPWVISSAEGLTFLRDKYYLYFDAGEEGDYTISTSETGVETILDGEVIEVPVFNLHGLKVADSTDNLPAGIYIIAGKKVVVK